MALQVWLPLNKSEIKNQGCENPAMTIAGTQAYADGKLGKCLTLQGSNSIYVKIPYTNIGTKMSVCCWVKANAPGSWSDIFGFGNNNRIEKSTTTQYYFYSAGNPLITSGTALFTMDDAVWTHIVMTADGTNVKFYINGALSKTVAQANPLLTVFSGYEFFTIGIRTVISSPYKGYMNDFRIYDHCLSQQEVREISKGLILHYPLDYFKGVTGSNVNLAKGNFSCYTTSAGNTTSGSATFDTSIVSLNSLIGKTLTFSFYYSIEGAKQNTDTSDWQTYRYGIHLTMVGVQGGTTETTYPCANYLTMSGTGRAVQHLTIPSDYTSISSLSFSIQPRNKPASGNNATWYLKQIKMELGNVATDWCPNSSDPEYNQLGYNDNTVYDCSGFENKGTITGTPTVDSDTSRYSCCAYINSSSYILGPAMKTDGVLSLNVWHKSASDTNLFYIGSWEYEGFGLWYDGTNYKAESYISSGYRTITYATTVPQDKKWHMYTFTFNGTVEKIYLDGVEVGSLSYTGVIAFHATAPLCVNGNPDSTGSSVSSKYNGYWSDVRIYATALSADDVKLLYNRGASIDNAGNLHCGELVEDNTLAKQQIKKNTQVKCRNFSELPLKYDDTIYVEPDGSMWVRIVRQNAPGTVANNFASTDSFTTSVYKNVNTWFYGVMCNYVNKWEFMCKQKAQTANNETKFRWVQSVNPMTADMAAIAAATVTKNTSSGYTATGSGFTGIYAKQSSSYITTYQPSATGNTWGRFGQWQQYQSGLAGTNGVTVTTGYSDLYLRIDNVTFVNLPANTKTQFLKSGDINSTEIYEQ